MEITLTEGPGHLLVRAQGCLSLGTVSELRDTLLKAAAEQPRGVVCDLRDVSAGPLSLTVLHEVADQVAEWPGTPLVLVADDVALTDRLARLGLDRRLPVVADPAAAAAALRHAPGFLVTACGLPPTADAPAAARAFVTGVLGRWQAADAAEVARWVVSELVTNTVVHARTEATVKVSLTRRWIGLSVADRGPGGILRAARPGLRGGWGLTVVAELTRRWGVRPRMGGGWVVWSVLDADAPAYPVMPQQAARSA